MDTHLPTNEIIKPARPIAIVRLEDMSAAEGMALALLEGGIDAIEFTLSHGDALSALPMVKAALGDRVTLGMGTVLDEESAKRSIAAGAQFIVTPVLLPGVVEIGVAEGVPVVCGAFTPTEIYMASMAGATIVKVFPAARLGPSYIKDVLGPFPRLKLLPTGGINLENCRSYLDAGAYTVAIGSNLVSAEIVAARDWPRLSALAAQYVSALKNSRR